MNKQLFIVKNEMNKYHISFLPLYNHYSPLQVNILSLSLFMKLLCKKFIVMKKLLFLLSFVFAICCLNAQSYELVIKMNDETETTWNSESLSNIYFDDETTLILVEKEDSYTHSYNISEIKKLYFNSSENINELNQDKVSFVFPNPAKDKIQIIGVENQEIEIISIDGKPIFRGKYDGKSLDVSLLPQGLYLIKTNNKTLKFEKI